MQSLLIVLMIINPGTLKNDGMDIILVLGMDVNLFKRQFKIYLKT